MILPRATVLFVATGLLTTVGAAPAFADSIRSPSGELDWSLCADIARGWDPDDDVTECATVTVPLDHDEPDGRTIDIAVNRVPATEESSFPILLNPGGPGHQGVTMPRQILDSQAADLGRRHDLVGFDARGVGYSEGFECEYDWSEPDPALRGEERDRYLTERDTQTTLDCYDRDPRLAASMTTENVARDMEVVREALGVERIGFFGVSWGSLLGATYRSMYDDRVEAMLLESVVSPDFNVSRLDEGQIAAADATFHRFTDWISVHDAVYGLGEDPEELRASVLDLQRELALDPRTGPDGRIVDHDSVTALLATPQREWPANAEALTVLLEGGVPDQRAAAHNPGGTGWDAETTGANHFALVAMQCNDSDSPRDFATVWQNKVERSERFPAMGTMGFNETTCVGWPLEGATPALSAGESPLQLVAHTHEVITPHWWAREMRDVIGGELMSVEDDGHGTLTRLDCAEAAVTFFATGRTTTQTCPGPALPDPSA